MASTKRYLIRLTVEVDEDHVAYDDPGWIADAAWGALSNEYGLRCTYHRPEPVSDASD